MLATLLLTVAALHGVPGYVRYPLHELVAVADRIVLGTVGAVQENTFDVSVEATLVGAPQATLRVPKFEDWTCARRYAPYHPGQRVLLFLRQGAVIGAGNEGEMPLIGEGVLVPYPVRGSRCVARAIAGGSLSSSWVPLADIAGCLADFCAAFAFTPARFGLEPGGTRPTVSAAELDALSARSSFARELVDDTLSCRCVRGSELPAENEVPSGVVTARSLREGRPWAKEDGLELRGAFAQSLVVESSGAGLDVVAGNPLDARAAFLRLAANGTVSPVECVDAERLGRALDSTRSSFGPPDFGAALARLSDLDGDGLGELAVGAPGNSFEHAERHVGSIYLVSRPREGPARLVHALEPANAPDGLIDGCDFGRALCAPGDLDGDGRSELVVSRKPDLDGKRARWPPCSLAVLFLDREGRVGAWNAIAAADVGFEGREEFGRILAGPGDVDRDGVPDLVLGEPLDCGAGLYRGALRVALLSRSGGVRQWKRIDADSSATLELELGDEFGMRLAAAGDLDCDGVPDLVVAGTRALWSVLLARDGSVKRARRHSLGSLSAGIDPVALAAGSVGARGTPLLLAATFGTRRPFDLGLVRLSLDGEGRLAAD